MRAKENNKLIGNVYFQQQEPKEFLTWEIGYVLNPEYYGNGYATEECKRVLNN
ncbi:GNAT family N-acetyltransferase [Clostridium sp. FP1]|uniref:GNAT family N-acetyltransferase n=1 Tax=Clostridium sp. FP1 TaxID=2724076 RepID=UPI001CCFDD80|nr:GNAT family N-acetyltransferase [Clostridium sp. FP1]MBZ9637593.1 GNAT family N-acetyltransferase [Clostridium sp. FP1]